jgi:hypothetical protein
VLVEETGDVVGVAAVAEKVHRVGYEAEADDKAEDTVGAREMADSEPRIVAQPGLAASESDYKPVSETAAAAAAWVSGA